MSRLLTIAENADVDPLWLPRYVREYIEETERRERDAARSSPRWLRPMLNPMHEEDNVFTVKWIKLRHPSIAFGVFTLRLRVLELSLFGMALDHMVTRERETNGREQIGPLFEQMYLETLGGPLPLDDAGRRFVQDLRYFVDNWRSLAQSRNTTLAANSPMFRIDVSPTPALDADAAGPGVLATREVTIVCHDQFVRWLAHRTNGSLANPSAPVTRLVEMITAQGGPVEAGVPAMALELLSGRREHWNEGYAQMRGMLALVVSEVHKYAAVHPRSSGVPPVGREDARVFVPPFVASREAPPRFDDSHDRRPAAHPRPAFIRTYDNIRDITVVMAEARMWYGVDERTYRFAASAGSDRARLSFVR